MNLSHDLLSRRFGQFIELKTHSNEYVSSNSTSSFITKVIRWSGNYLLSIADNHLIHYPSPINLTYAWSFGSSAGICLVIQILSGIFFSYALHSTY